MSIVRIAIPVFRGKRRFHLDKGRAWSVIEHLVLTALAKEHSTAEALAEKSKLPRRIVIEAIIRLMEAGWVQLAQKAEGIIFSATSRGKSVSEKEELPANLRRIARWRSFVTDRITGAVFRSRELSVFEKHVLEKRAQQEAFVWIEPREIKNEDPVRSVIATLFDEDERFVLMEPSGDRLVERFAVVTYRNEKVEGLPSRAPKELEEIITAAGKSRNVRSSNTAIYKPPAVSDEIDPANLTPRSIVFQSEDLVLGASQHQDLFSAIIKECRHELVIHSTFVNSDRLEVLMPALTAAIQRGTRIDILWGQGNEKTEVASSKRAIDELRRKVSSMALDEVFQVHPFSTRSHAKLIVADTGRADRHVAIVGSCNWLSSTVQSFEASIRIREPFLVSDVTDQIAALSLGDDGHWTELTNYLACLSADIRLESIPNGPRALAHLVLGPEHGAMVRRARDLAERRLFVTSHRFSSVGRPAVILPALAAVEAKEGLEARLYFGIPSGEGAGAVAADLTREASLAGVSIRPVREPRVHAKVLAWDDDDVVISSQNWLSADPSEGNRRKEIGVFVHAAGAGRHVIAVFDTLRRP